MPKSLVEKFEQILSADPSSMVFVELGKSLLERGETGRAVEVCRAGLDHHPESILGRVLLGRALLLAKKPDDAFLELERAVAVDPENPYGYNLVAEVLMKHGARRHALPILEQALKFQPGDLRLQQWLVQARSDEPDPELANEVGSETDPELARPPIPPPPTGSEASGEATAEAGAEAIGDPPAEAAPKRRRASDLLLSDLPEFPELKGEKPPAPPTTPTVSEVQRIAENYEQTLRDELEQQQQKPKSFLRRHWLVVTLAATVAIGAGVSFAGFRITKRRYTEQHAHDFLARAKDGLLLDSYASLSGALHQMGELLELDPHRSEALVVAAQTQAMLCHDFGCSEAERAQAITWLEDAKAGGKLDGDAQTRLVARSYLASDRAARAPIDDEVLRVAPAVAGPWIHYLAGLALLGRNNEGEALRRFDLGLKLAPAHVPMLATVGENALTKGDFGRAAELFGLAHSASPSNVESAVGLAEAHLALHESVEQDEKDLTQISAASADAIPKAFRQRLDLALARVLAADGKLEKAIGAVQDSLQQHPDELSVYEGVLADCYAAAGQYDKAETEAWRALSKDHQDPDALARYGEILLARHRDRELLQRVPVVQNSRRLHVLRAQAALRTGNLPLARTEIEATRKDNKVPAAAAVLSAEVAARSGDAPGAKQTLDQIGALAHPPAEAFLALAQLAQDAGDSAAAIANAREATQVDPRSFEAHAALGRLLAKAGQTDDAEAELRAAIRLNQQDVEAQVALANLDLDRGSAKDARPILEAAVGEDPLDESALLSYARALQALDEINDAVRAAARATKVAPQDARGHHLLGKLALAAGDRKLALKELKEAKRLDKKDQTIGQDLALAEKKR